MTKKELKLELKIQELQRDLDTIKEAYESAYQKNIELQENADDIFKNSPYCKQLIRDLDMAKEAYKSANHRLELSHQREEKLRDRLEALEKRDSVQAKLSDNKKIVDVKAAEQRNATQQKKSEMQHEYENYSR